ncbi:hypothetical protein CJU89_2175 [Yarrowia sp. B02]|nr:hypothetical protein CJU89_2175 [Yarrowia sp. B02]
MLPPEVWLNVCSYLDTNSLHAVSLSSWMLHQCASTHLWNSPTRPLHTVRHAIPLGWTATESSAEIIDPNSPPPTPEPLNPLFADYDGRSVGLLATLERSPDAELFCRHYVRRLLLVYNSSDPWCTLDSEFGHTMLTNNNFQNLRDLTICIFGNGSSTDPHLDKLKEGFFQWCSRGEGRNVHITCKNSTFLSGESIDKSVYLALHSVQLARICTEGLNQLLENSTNLKYLSVCSSPESTLKVCLRHMSGLEYLDMDSPLYSRVVAIPVGLKTLKITGLNEVPADLLRLVENVHRLYLEIEVLETERFCQTVLETEFDFTMESVRELHIVGGVTDLVVLKLLELTPQARVLVVRDAQRLSNQACFESLHCKKNLEMISWSTQDESVIIS